MAHAHDLPVSPIGTTPVGLMHAATAVPNHITTELQDLEPPKGLTLDVCVDNGRFVLGDSPGLGMTLDEDAIALIDKPSSVPLRAGPHIRRAHAGNRLDFEPPR